MNTEQFGEFKERLIQRGESCPICHSKFANNGGDSLCAMATAIITSRGHIHDPRTLWRNYVRCTFVCCNASEAREMIPYEMALRIVAENRASTDTCDITIFPPMSDSAMITCIIIEETMLRISILIQQTYSRGYEKVSQVLRSFQNIIDRYFHDNEFTDQHETISLESPFDCDSKDGKLLAQCSAIFAVWCDMREEKTPFEEAIASIMQQLCGGYINKRDNATVTAATCITFPIQIEKSKKMILKLSATFPPRYEFVRT